MKKEEALKLVDQFPELSKRIHKQINNAFPTYIIANKRRKEMRCSKCGNISPDIAFDSQNGARITCPVCGKTGLYIKDHYPYSNSLDTGYFMVLLSSPKDENLYIRCFSARLYVQKGKLAPEIKLTETQRYVFTGSSAVRYGKNHFWQRNEDGRYEKKWNDFWTVRSKVNEPVFDGVTYYYDIINANCVKKTCFRYSEFTRIKFNLYNVCPIPYLLFYQKHKGCERLIKCGLEDLVKEHIKPYGSRPDINWHETEPHKMLGVNREAFRAIRDNKIDLVRYRQIYKEFPELPIEKLIVYSRVLGGQSRTLHSMARITGERRTSILNYLVKNNITIDLYRDYIEACREIDSDLGDPVIVYPKNFMAAHDRTFAARKAVVTPDLKEAFAARIDERRELEFSFGDFMVIQPNSAEEIVAEGKALHHCVGGYAERHARGRLTIMFLRKKSDPDKPYYAIEVNNNYEIVQCRGYANNRAGNPKPQKIVDFEKKYQEYLDILIRKEARKNDKTGNENATSGRKPRGNGRVHKGSEPQPQDNNGGTARTAVAV